MRAGRTIVSCAKAPLDGVQKPVESTCLILANRPRQKSQFAGQSEYPMTLRTLVPAAIAAAALLASSAHAQTPAPGSVMVVSPVYSQLVAFSIPANFVAGAERNDGSAYTREAVPKGETAEKWNEKITVTGAKGLATQPNASAEKLAGVIGTA